MWTNILNVQVGNNQAFAQTVYTRASWNRIAQNHAGNAVMLSNIHVPEKYENNIRKRKKYHITHIVKS